MIPWKARPKEVANLLNPAFCGEVLHRTINEYENRSEQSFPYPLSFLVLPIVLHKKTRESIKSRTRQAMHTWLIDHQDVRVGFAERTKHLVPITKESITFLMQVGAISMGDDGGLRTTSRLDNSITGQGQNEIVDCYTKAKIVGKWFARAGTTPTIYTMWGVKP